MKVYLVTSGEYSDFRVIGVFSTPEKAEIAKRELDGDDVDERELDDMFGWQEGLRYFLVGMDKDGCGADAEASEVYADRAKLSIYAPYGTLRERCAARLWARDEEHAIKIVNERRIAVLAANRWQPGEIND